MNGDTSIRALGAIRVALGGLWLAALAADRAAAGATLPPAGRLAAIVLAGRDVAQGALLVSKPRSRVALTGAVIDGLHAASMLPVAALVPRYRTPAAVSAGVAVAWMGGAAWALTAGRPR